MAKLWVSNSETPEPVITKFSMGDYVSDMTQQCTARQNSNLSPQWGLAGKSVKYHSHVVFSFFSLWPQFLLASRDQTREPIFTLFDS